MVRWPGAYGEPDAAAFEVDHQIAIALATLYKSLVRVRGAGRFGNPSATIVLDATETPKLHWRC